MDKELVVRGYTLMSEDGVTVRLEETVKRESIVLSLCRGGKVETASLNKDMFDALMELRYNIDVYRPKPPKGEKEEAVAAEAEEEA